LRGSGEQRDIVRPCLCRAALYRFPIRTGRYSRHVLVARSGSEYESSIGTPQREESGRPCVAISALLTTASQARQRSSGSDRRNRPGGPRHRRENSDNKRATDGLHPADRYHSMDNKKRKPGSNWWYLLLLVQFVGALWVPFYNAVEPTWAGIPFFYWYQMLLVFIGAGITAIVYFATE
jgi:Protein of unknown function (DUF3311)